MNIIVAGLGEVGYHLVRKLYQEGHNVCAIDADDDKTRRVGSERDIRIVRGYAASAKILQQAGCAETDLLLAVTDSDETNLVTCFHGKHLGAKRSIARIKRTDRLFARRNTYREEMGIDLLVSPQNLAITEVLKIVRDPVAMAIENFGRGKVTVRRFKLPEASPWTETRLKDVTAIKDSILALVTRNGRSFVPAGGDVLKVGDHVFLVSTPARMLELERTIGNHKDAVHNVMIIGGGTIGVGLALGLEALEIKARLIESNRKQCDVVVERVKKTAVIHGDGLDLSLLKEEHISAMSVFVACTGKDETNLMAALLAKQYGVPKVVAILQSVDNALMGEKLGIDSVFTPALLAADRIFQYIMGGAVQNIATVAEGEAEVVEMVVPAKSAAANRPLSAIAFPKGSIVGAVIRREEVIIPSGSFEMAAGDTVILFALSDVVKKVEKLIHG